MSGKAEYVIRVSNESGDDFGEHTFPSKPSDDKLEERLRKISPGDWDVYGENTGPGFRGSYMHVTHVVGRAPLFVDPPAPRKSLAGPRGRKLRELCRAAQAVSDEEAKVNELAIGETVLLRYAEGVKWPKWVGRAGDLNINHIEAVLDALGVPQIVDEVQLANDAYDVGVIADEAED